MNTLKIKIGNFVVEATRPHSEHARKAAELSVAVRRAAAHRFGPARRPHPAGAVGFRVLGWNSAQLRDATAASIQESIRAELLAMAREMEDRVVREASEVLAVPTARDAFDSTASCEFCRLSDRFLSPSSASRLPQVVELRAVGDFQRKHLICALNL
jgi:hypothetical protein